MSQNTGILAIASGIECNDLSLGAVRLEVSKSVYSKESQFLFLTDLQFVKNKKLVSHKAAK